MQVYAVTSTLAHPISDIDPILFRNHLPLCPRLRQTQCAIVLHAHIRHSDDETSDLGHHGAGIRLGYCPQPCLHICMLAHAGVLEPRRRYLWRDHSYLCIDRCGQHPHRPCHYGPAHVHHLAPADAKNRESGLDTCLWTRLRVSMP